MSNGKMKIQINSLEALERMIGGDTEVEIEVRRSIMEEFAKKHLKALADSELQRFAEGIIESAKRELSKGLLKTQGSWPYNSLELSSEAKGMVKGEMLTVAKNEVVKAYESMKAQVEEIAKSYEPALERFIKRYVTEAMEKKVKQEVDAEIERRWEKLKSTLA